MIHHSVQRFQRQDNPLTPRRQGTHIAYSNDHFTPYSQRDPYPPRWNPGLRVTLERQDLLRRLKSIYTTVKIVLITNSATSFGFVKRAAGAPGLFTRIRSLSWLTSNFQVPLLRPPPGSPLRGD